MDETRNVRQEWMVRVDHYFTHHGKQIVWARPTGLDIQCYHGDPAALELEIVEDRYRNRIYFEAPFCYISGAQDGAWNNARKYGVTATETVINLLGLQNGWIVHVDNEKDVDMLAALYHACINFEPRKEEAQEQEQIKQQKVYENEAAQANAWGRRGNGAWAHRDSHWPPSSSTSPSSHPKGPSSPEVKDEPKVDDDDDRVYNRNFRSPRTPARSRPTPGISLTPTRGTPSRTHPYHRRHAQASSFQEHTYVHPANLRALEERKKRAKALEDIRMKKATKDTNNPGQVKKEPSEVDLTEETETNHDMQQALWESMKNFQDKRFTWRGGQV